MALKEKALKRLCEKLTKSDIRFCLAGSWMLSQRGMEISWHSFDVVVDPEQFSAADRILTRLGMRNEVVLSEDNSEVHFHFDGADIQLLSGFSLHGTVYRLPESMETISVLGQQVPLMTPEDWYALLLHSGNQKEAQSMGSFFQSHPFRMHALSPSLAAYAPSDGRFPFQ
ncbi:MAG: hypothetical protein K6A68_12235 [Clostridiales bacterium]|nr:hypothetical protein [Clostridiales bacterium]